MEFILDGNFSVFVMTKETIYPVSQKFYFLDVYNREILIYVDVGVYTIKMFISAFIIIMKSYKQPKCLSIWE